MHSRYPKGEAKEIWISYLSEKSPVKSFVKVFLSLLVGAKDPGTDSNVVLRSKDVLLVCELTMLQMEFQTLVNLALLVVCYSYPIQS